jgi:hypothetical protein
VQTFQEILSHLTISYAVQKPRLRRRNHSRTNPRNNPLGLPTATQLFWQNIAVQAEPMRLKTAVVNISSNSGLCRRATVVLATFVLASSTL